MKLPLKQAKPVESIAPPTRSMRGLPLLLASGVGLLLGFLLDPEQGKRRRNMLRDRLAGAIRRSGIRAARGARAIGAETYGVTQKVTHVRPAAREYDDVTLARKVESELFRGTGISAGQVNVNVENGVLFLRGQVQHPEDIELLEHKARGIDGVYEVENLLHLPGTPARMS